MSYSTDLERLYRKYSNAKNEREKRWATEDLILGSETILYWLARQIIMPPGIDLEDIVQSARIHLYKIIPKFNPDYGFNFSTYAVTALRRKMVRSVDENSWSENCLRNHKKLTKAVKILTLENDRKPTDTEIISKLGIDEKRYKEILQASQFISPLYLDQEYDDTDPLIDIIQDNSLRDYELTIDKVFAIRRAIEELSDVQRSVLTLYLEEMTSAEISQMLGIPKDATKTIITQSKEIVVSYICKNYPGMFDEETVEVPEEKLNLVDKLIEELLEEILESKKKQSLIL